MKRLHFVNLAWLVFVGIAVGSTYYAAKRSYHAVGLIDGKTYEQERLIESLKKIKPIHACESTSDASIQEVISVKSTSLYYVKTEDRAFHFCIQE